MLGQLCPLREIFEVDPKSSLCHPLADQLEPLKNKNRGIRVVIIHPLDRTRKFRQNDPGSYSGEIFHAISENV